MPSEGTGMGAPQGKDKKPRGYQMAAFGFWLLPIPFSNHLVGTVSACGEEVKVQSVGPCETQENVTWSSSPEGPSSGLLPSSPARTKQP